jgi:hypothetical protein
LDISVTVAQMPVSGVLIMETTMNKENETYLGDGLYASFDGWMIRLRAPRLDGDHWVGLEPEVFDSLLAFAKINGWSKK